MGPETNPPFNNQPDIVDIGGTDSPGKLELTPVIVIFLVPVYDPGLWPAKVTIGGTVIAVFA
jgi:hypothetical protein